MGSEIKISVPTWQAVVKVGSSGFLREPPAKERTIKRGAWLVEQRETPKEKLLRLLREEEDKIWVRACLVEFTRPGCDPIRFRVNPLKDGRFTFSDPRRPERGDRRHDGALGHSACPSLAQAAVADAVGLQGGGRSVRWHGTRR